MMTKSKILGLLPPPAFQAMLIKDDQSVDDIIKEVCKAHKIFGKQYAVFADGFDQGNEVETAKYLFAFLKENVGYRVETEDFQTSKSPSRILEDGEGDCKHFALFSAGVWDQLGYDWCFRFASYNWINQKIGHVFTVIRMDDGSEIWFDPVLSELDSRNPSPIRIKDITFGKNNNMAIHRLSGVGASDLEAIYYDRYGYPLPDPKISKKSKGGFWDAVKDVGLGILTVLGGGAQSGQQPQDCYCPPPKKDTVNDIILPAAVGFGIAYFVMNKEKRRK